jgi:uncharacterized membrane protein
VEMAEIITIFLSFFRVILGLLLVLFIPGYAISFIFYPGIAGIPQITRIVLSCVISIGATLCAILFLDIVLGVNTTPVNITIIILFISVLACTIIGARRVFLFVMEKQKIKNNYPKDP